MAWKSGLEWKIQAELSYRPNAMEQEQLSRFEHEQASYLIRGRFFEPEHPRTAYLNPRQSAYTNHAADWFAAFANVGKISRENVPSNIVNKREPTHKVSVRTPHILIPKPNQYKDSPVSQALSRPTLTTRTKRLRKYCFVGKTVRKWFLIQVLLY
nr:hypothetical protein Iba_chr14bCG17450 [Ipomoea batatas]